MGTPTATFPQAYPQPQETQPDFPAGCFQNTGNPQSCPLYSFFCQKKMSNAKRRFYYSSCSKIWVKYCDLLHLSWRNRNLETSYHWTLLPNPCFPPDAHSTLELNMQQQKYAIEFHKTTIWNKKVNTNLPPTPGKCCQSSHHQSHARGTKPAAHTSST